jgi:hypothetical protein
MRKRKLQIFLSSTYEDLIDERLAAMEAILAAGHIPAAMEQFAPGDETAWEKIRTWIDESDAFIQILAGRYGSIEPESGKSYAQLEYEYAVDKKKPFFALVVSEAEHERRVKEFGLKVDERENAESYKAFRKVVTGRLCGSWNDKKDIKAAIFQKLPEWAQRSDLIGWVRGDEATNPEVMNELARLSHENRELRAKISSDNFDGLTFDQLSDILRGHKIEAEEVLPELKKYLGSIGPASGFDDLLGLFDRAYHRLAGGVMAKGNAAYVLNALVGFGLVEKELRGDYLPRYTISQLGRRFRNQFLIASSHPKGGKAGAQEEGE